MCFTVSGNLLYFPKLRSEFLHINPSVSAIKYSLYTPAR